MIVALAFLQRDPETGVFYYRRKFPTELTLFIPSASPTGRGRIEFKVSLRVKSMNEAEASAQRAAAEAAFDRIITEAKAAKASADKRAPGTFDRLSHRYDRYKSQSHFTRRACGTAEQMQTQAAISKDHGLHAQDRNTPYQ